ncbi:hypothetical protein EW026_g1889 [Hermanssonia centrifuga]|uniref:Uncharacterized protein n=1 Tax=Hermanssonia centrifuga TaxID=98765 RepID=A0A4S4KQK8_9APHY|nr:hypothetical protein EW026_g1889 [Hermanssonia centrifuga]
MAERIHADPNLTPQPDFEGPSYLNLREALVQAGFTQDAAIASFRQAWEQEQDHRKQLWAQQVEADAAAEVAARAAEALTAQEELEELRKESDKKKVKFAPFHFDEGLSGDYRPTISPYAFRKVEQKEHVELWYFTPEGTDEAKRKLYSVSEETFTIAKLEGGLGLRPATAHNHSSKAKPDSELSFQDFSLGWRRYLQTALDCKWPHPLVDMLGRFFSAIADHQFRDREPRPLGEQALMLYVQEARIKWHTIEKQERRCINLNPIAPDLLANCWQTVLDKHGEKALASCAAATFWSGQGKTRCRRNVRKRIINPDGLELCTDWQREVGCSQKGQRHNHECSGCGDSTHGAAECSLAQKA